VNAEELNRILARLKRLECRLADKDGIGMAWSASVSDGSSHKYIIKGVKDLDRIGDDVETMFIWLWSFKDYLKEYARSLDKSDKWVEAEASADPCLSVCADIANRVKHGNLRESRSGKWAQLGKLTYSVPQEAMGQITFRVFEVELDISNANLVTFAMPVLDANGRTIGDAFKFLERGVLRCEELLSEIERAA
jgi:hypothetical protein